MRYYRVLLFIIKPFPVKLRNEILKIYNKRPDNIYGENIRYLLIDQGFKEGIDVFDVKYVHIFDDLLTPSDEKQAIGRGTFLRTKRFRI